MIPVFYFKKWIELPKFGVPYKEASIFGERKFIYYSKKILSGIDESLSDLQRGYDYSGFWGWLRKHLNWNLCLILHPSSDDYNYNTMFKVGYCDESGCKISPTERFVKDGPFAMRVGPKNCYYFIVGDGPVSLKKGEYVSRKSKEARRGKYEKIKIQ